MTLTDLPTAPVINGVALRREAYRALNAVRIQHDITGGHSQSPAALREFFLALAKLCPQNPAPKAQKDPK